MAAQVYKGYNVRNDFLAFVNKESLAIVYDLETTGLNPNTDEITQVCARLCSVSPYGLTEMDMQSWYINPVEAIPENVIRKTRITDVIPEGQAVDENGCVQMEIEDEDERGNKFLRMGSCIYVGDKPREAEVIHEIYDYFASIPVIGYNNKRFDDRFLKNRFARYGLMWEPSVSMDLYPLAQETLSPDRQRLPNYQLSSIVKYFGLEQEISQFHNAEGDTYGTFLIGNKLYDLAKQTNTYEDLIKCTVKKLSFWQNKNRLREMRIYVETDVATFFFDIEKKQWELKDKSDRISKYDMDDMIAQCYKAVQAADVSEFAKFRGSIRI